MRCAILAGCRNEWCQLFLGFGGARRSNVKITSRLNFSSGNSPYRVAKVILPSPVMPVSTMVISAMSVGSSRVQDWCSRSSDPHVSRFLFYPDVIQSYAEHRVGHPSLRACWQHYWPHHPLLQPLVHTTRSLCEPAYMHLPEVHHHLAPG